MKVWVDHEAGEVRMTGRLWVGEAFPFYRLPSRIAFYRRMRDRAGGRYRDHYAPVVAALEAAQSEIEAMQRARCSSEAPRP